MPRGETDYEVREVWFSVKKKRLAVCDTQLAALRKLARLKWPKNGLAVVPVRRKEEGA